MNIKISVRYSCENLERGGVAGSSPLENSLITLNLTSAGLNRAELQKDKIRSIAFLAELKKTFQPFNG